MIGIKIICVGNLKEKYLVDACAEYKKRLSTLCNFSLVEISEYKLPQKISDALIDKALEEEAKAILNAAKGCKIIPLCIEGKQMDSEKFSQHISQSAVNGSGNIAFVIGSSHGLAETVKKSGVGFSMSKMTFPHQVARLMLLEQVYRAFQIMNNTKYHK